MLSHLKSAAKNVKKLLSAKLTTNRGGRDFSGTRELSTRDSSDMNREPDGGTSQKTCPYCASQNLKKRGTRKKKYEVVQLYFCKDCNRTFTDQFVKGRRFPLRVIIEAITLYNLGHTINSVSRLLKSRFGVQPKVSTISGWINEHTHLCRYERLRSYIMKAYTKENLIEEVTMAHKQIYRFRYHRGKMVAQLEEIKHRNFKPLRDFLEEVPSATPHHHFEKGIRISDVRSKFDKSQMIVKGKLISCR